MLSKVSDSCSEEDIGTMGGHQIFGFGCVPPYSINLISGATNSSSEVQVLSTIISTLRRYTSLSITLAFSQVQTTAEWARNIKTLAA
jgi:hypothetical protein